MRESSNAARPRRATTGRISKARSRRCTRSWQSWIAELERTGRPAAETEPDPRVESELGDLLFTVVNLARFVNVDPELALRGTSARFRDRVERAEQLAAEAGETWTELDLDAQERWYERAKSASAD